jgi:hypothetical protein
VNLKNWSSETCLGFISISIELTLNPSLGKRGTYLPSLFKRRGRGMSSGVATFALHRGLVRGVSRFVVLTENR